MLFENDTKNLLHINEVLRAIIDVRDNSLTTIVKEIYENSGQLLCLALLKLAMIDLNQNQHLRLEITELTKLVTEVIQNLRYMSRNFYPEHEILSESGIINALKQELEISPEDNTNQRIKIKGIPYALSPGKGIILFQVILQITGLIKKNYAGDSVSIAIVYKSTTFQIKIKYPGAPVDLYEEDEITDDPYGLKKLSVAQRISLIGAQMTITNNRETRIVLTCNNAGN